MGRPPILDTKIKLKIAKKIGVEDTTVINRMVYKRARNLVISSEAALIILAKEYDIGTSIYQRSLDPAKQAEVRAALSTIFASKTRPLSNGQMTVQKNMRSQIGMKDKRFGRSPSRLPWLILNPNIYGIGLNLKKIKWLQKWFGKDM
jgi:hypothetical protein